MSRYFNMSGARESGLAARLVTAAILIAVFMIFFLGIESILRKCDREGEKMERLVERIDSLQNVISDDYELLEVDSIVYDHDFGNDMKELDAAIEDLKDYVFETYFDGY